MRLRDRLIPATLFRSGPEARFRAELVLALGIFEFCATAVFASTEWLFGTRAIGVIYGMSCVLMLAVLVRFRRGGDIDGSAHALMAVLFLAVGVVNFGSGGAAIGANISLPTLVVLAMLMLPSRAAWLWTVLVLIEVLAIARLRPGGGDFPIHVNARWVQGAVDRVPLFLSLAAALIGALTQRAMRRYRVHLEQARAAEAQAREDAAASAERFHDFAQVAADGFWETDEELRLTYVSASFAAALGMLPEKMLGLTPEQAYRRRYPTAKDVERFMLPLERRESFDNQQIYGVDARGTGHMLLNRGRPVFNGTSGFAGYRGVIQDVTERVRMARQLKHLAERDPLTGLLNRRAMQGAIRGALAEAGAAETARWLCCIDLDQFKQVNDCAGHAAGDGVLRRFAQLLRECTRSGEKLARMGGDEFCLLLEGDGDDAAMTVASRILDRIGELTIEWDGRSLATGASFGLAELRAGEDIEALFARADAACYRSKREGRNRATVAA